MKSLVLLLVIATQVACGDKVEPLPSFEPTLAFEYTIGHGTEAMDMNVSTESTVRTSEYLPEGETLRGERYVVPGFLCLRADGTDWNDLPAEAVTPGESAIFEVIYPTDPSASGPLVFMPHGDSLEFIEALSLEVWNLSPDLAEMNGVHPETGTRGVEQSTVYGAKRNTVSETVGLRAITLARLGATVIVPGICWGDGGHGQGETSAGYFSGRRLGGAFDHATWSWAKETLTHAAEKEIAFGCSGGGHRIAEELIRDNQAFTAVVLDSPADNVAEFMSNPLPDLIATAISVLRSKKFGSIMDDFYNGTFGSVDKAARASLGAELPTSDIDAPIYLIYSTQDPLVTRPVVRALAENLGARGAPNLVVELDDDVHCQLRTDESMSAAIDWLSENGGF